MNKFHSFLNKVVTIVSTDSETISVFPDMGFTVNSDDIIRSITVIWRELKFSLDTDLTSLPILPRNQADSAAE